MTDYHLEVGESKIRQYANRKPIDAVAELVWNSLDANAKKVRIDFKRTAMQALERILVIDDGDGITPEQARSSFLEYGDTWKAFRTHTKGNQRILHGKKGEGRLFGFALGSFLTWDSIVTIDGKNYRTKIYAETSRPTHWRIDEPVATSDPTGTTVTILVPQGKRLGSLEVPEARSNLTARLAFYLRAYNFVSVIYDGKELDVESIISEIVDLQIDLPSEYAEDSRPPFVTFVEWKERTRNRKLLVCNADGIALAEHGQDWTEPVVSFTPYLRSDRFNNQSSEELHLLEMSHSPLLYAAEKAIRKHLSKRHKEISGQVVQQLKDEGIYPYIGAARDATEVVERQTFDLVVTVARSALPGKGDPRKLSVNLIRSALESNPGSLHDILEKVLSLTQEERDHLSHLLEQTELTNVISAATTVTNRLNFIGGLRKIFADRDARVELREVDQLHPMVARNLWLFGEEWTLARSEIGLTSALASHLHLLGDEIVLEANLKTVRREDGRTGRVDILLYRGIGDERQNERLIVELKRPSLPVGKEELYQIKSYARAIVEDPQFRGTACKWKFVLVTYDTHTEIRRDIRQVGKAPGLADDQDEYQVWVKTWGEIFDETERKLWFFREQLKFEATDDRVTQYLRNSYDKYIPESLRGAETASSARTEE
ncbi:ATP-binding protein [Protofrankia coriariae]|uniref:ATP-binding protein n=1 Tax=Protofrankia coriariae TaxID=1562887 RepID=UPI0006405186|nr:ATP-binding protein [Protofrankia coriariae]